MHNVPVITQNPRTGTLTSPTVRDIVLQSEIFMQYRRLLRTPKCRHEQQIVCNAMTR